MVLSLTAEISQPSQSSISDTSWVPNLKIKVINMVTIICMMTATMMRIWEPKHERSCHHCQQKSNKATAHTWVKHDKHDKQQHNDHRWAGLSPSRVCGEILDFSLPVSRNFQRRSVTPASYISTIMMMMMMICYNDDDDGDDDDDQIKENFTCALLSILRWL